MKLVVVGMLGLEMQVQVVYLSFCFGGAVKWLVWEPGYDCMVGEGGACGYVVMECSNYDLRGLRWCIGKVRYLEVR